MLPDVGGGAGQPGRERPAPPHGGDVYAAAARWGLDPDRVLDFSANLNPFGPPPGVVEAVRAALGRIRLYPEPHSATLAAALAEREGVPAPAVVVGAGATELIRLAALLARGGVAVAPSPTFGEYPRAVEAAGGTWVSVPLDPDRGFRPDVAALGGAARAARARLFFLCNPNNPTGVLLPAGEVLELAGVLAAQDCLLVVDESFVDLTPDPPAASVLAEAPRRPGLVVIRSLTKFYALPGLRLGYAVAAPALAGALRRLQDPWSVGALAQVAGRQALAEEAYAARTRAWVAEEPARLYRELAAIPGLRPLPPAANFILVDGSSTGLAAWELQERLGPLGILIRDCRSFGLPAGYFRVAVRTREDNARLLAALRRALGEGV
ncbi:threonine-phosphate decarboxylase CobD [Caldinitratiruptor microaerophilus]|uniref:threonine-phosphate decarboxylase n=1 Tax=Caldinitratiruptor microaerophilus TaxID=671077 RepID=A0AA35CM40_9FIRM|nr:threonine-phosphate decarboxylase CobD [Caldinitratiruptor microaerophilus]BDG60898.1 threonine-phosphate decarboxylase [Caldinitratiruptor microaerophilus]